VGNGGKMRLWKDKLLNQSIVLKSQYPREGQNEDARVADVIDWDSNGWNPNWLHELFDVGTVEAICQIPIGSINNANVPIWRHIAKGKFTVHNAYHL
jgi:hypothetical protein